MNGVWDDDGGMQVGGIVVPSANGVCWAPRRLPISVVVFLAQSPVFFAGLNHWEAAVLLFCLRWRGRRGRGGGPARRAGSVACTFSVQVA